MKLLFYIMTISLTLLTAHAIALAGDLKGKPRIVDGDTIEIGVVLRKYFCISNNNGVKFIT